MDQALAENLESELPTGPTELRMQKWGVEGAKGHAPLSSGYWLLHTPIGALGLVRNSRGWLVCAPPVGQPRGTHERCRLWLRERGLREIHAETRHELVEIIREALRRDGLGAVGAAE